MTEVLDHVVRARLPWRDGPGLTECGRPVDEVAQAITLDEFVAKYREQGQQRCAMTTCMTCWSTAERWHRVGGSNDPFLSAIVREVRLIEHAAPGEPPQIVAELRAIAALVDAHRDAFVGYLTAHAETVPLDQRRRAARAARR